MPLSLSYALIIRSSEPAKTRHHLLAGGDHDALQVSVDRQVPDQAFERPVLIPLPVGLMVKMPGQLAGDRARKKRSSSGVPLGKISR